MSTSLNPESEIPNPSPDFRLLLVIPAYHESDRLPTFLAELGSAVQRALPGGRILVVDDGSEEEEQLRLRQLVESARTFYPCILSPLLLEQNHGKGGAILAGWDSVDSTDGFDYLAFVDADGAVPVSEVIRLVGMLTPAAESSLRPALFASRVKMLGKSIKRSAGRHLMGRVFASMVGILINADVYDSQCGLKFLPSSVFRSIRHRLKGRQFAFDVELISALKGVGYPMFEVPINWEDISGSKVSLITDTLKMAKAVLEIRRESQKLVAD